MGQAKNFQAFLDFIVCNKNLTDLDLAWGGLDMKKMC